MGSRADGGRGGEPPQPAGAPAGSDGLAPARAEFDPRVAYKAVLLAVGLFAAGLLFGQLSQLVILVVVAVVLAVPLAASANWLRRWHVPRPLGVILSALAGAAAAGLLLAFVVPTFVNQVNDFVAQLPSNVSRVESTVNHLLGLHRGATTKAVTQFVNRYTQHPAVLLGPLATIGLSIASAIGAIVVVLISALYMAISPAPLVNGLVRLFPAANRPDVLRTLERIRMAWLGWLRGVALDMLVLGGLLFIGMKIVGLQFAAGFAIFSALLTVIPNYGSVISAIPPIALGSRAPCTRPCWCCRLCDRQPDRGERRVAAHHGATSTSTLPSSPSGCWWPDRCSASSACSSRCRSSCSRSSSSTRSGSSRTAHRRARFCGWETGPSDTAEHRPPPTEPRRAGRRPAALTW